MRGSERSSRSATAAALVSSRAFWVSGNTVLLSANKSRAALTTAFITALRRRRLWRRWSTLPHAEARRTRSRGELLGTPVAAEGSTPGEGQRQQPEQLLLGCRPVRRRCCAHDTATRCRRWRPRAKFPRSSTSAPRMSWLPRAKPPRLRGSPRLRVRKCGPLGESAASRRRACGPPGESAASRRRACGPPSESVAAQSVWTAKRKRSVAAQSVWTAKRKRSVAAQSVWTASVAASRAVTVYGRAR